MGFYFSGSSTPRVLRCTIFCLPYIIPRPFWAEAFLTVCFQTDVTPNARNSASTTLNATLCPLGYGAKSGRAVNGSASVWTHQVFESATFNPPQRQVTRNGEQLAPGLLFFVPTYYLTAVNATQDEEEQAPLIMTDAGQLVWNGPYLNARNVRVAAYQCKAILTFWKGFITGGANVGHGYGNIAFLDSSYNEILTACPKLGLVTPTDATYECEADFHDIYLTDRNTLYYYWLQLIMPPQRIYGQSVGRKKVGSLIVFSQRSNPRMEAFFFAGALWSMFLSVLSYAARCKSAASAHKCIRRQRVKISRGQRGCHCGCNHDRR